jgi:hypothetical protein
MKHAEENEPPSNVVTFKTWDQEKNAWVIDRVQCGRVVAKEADDEQDN